MAREDERSASEEEDEEEDEPEDEDERRCLGFLGLVEEPLACPLPLAAVAAPAAARWSRMATSWRNDGCAAGRTCAHESTESVSTAHTTPVPVAQGDSGESEEGRGSARRTSYRKSPLIRSVTLPLSCTLSCPIRPSCSVQRLAFSAREPNRPQAGAAGLRSAAGASGSGLTVEEDEAPTPAVVEAVAAAEEADSGVKTGNLRGNWNM